MAVHVPKASWTPPLVGTRPSKTRMAVTGKGGKPAHSAYKVLWTAPEDRFSLVQVRIASGRTHQIRVHMRHVGHPLLGDPTYCPASFTGWQDEVPGLNALLRRPMLHAWKLGLPHPRTHQPLSFVLPPPKDMLRVILAGSRTMQRIGLTGMPGCGKSLLLAELAALGLPDLERGQGRGGTVSAGAGRLGTTCEEISGIALFRTPKARWTSALCWTPCGRRRACAGNWRP
jgi:hypothetical protein